MSEGRQRPRSIVILTGAGVSAESGIDTFRNGGGLWEQHRVEDVATPEAFARDPELVLRFYDMRRARIQEVEPNAAHEALARLVSEQALEALPNRSVRVPVITREKLEDLARARVLIEGEVTVRALPHLGQDDFARLKAAIAKLQLNDAAFQYMAESSVALGFGFRCGFLGLLHMEIILERLRREFDMDIIATYPSVIYEVERTNGEVLRIDNPDQLPDPSVIEEIREPMVRCFVMIPNEYISPIMQLIMEKRGEVSHTESIDTKRVMLTTEIPLNEILVDFVDKLKSITRGYGSMDYEQAGYKPAKLVKLEMLVNSEPVDAFSCIVHREKAESRGRALAAKLKEVIPQQLYQVAIQAAIGGKIIARESVSALRKNVTAKCYGGDITRKRKLLEKQKEGKKRMKAVGSVNIPQEAFIQVLRTS